MRRRQEAREHYTAALALREGGAHGEAVLALTRAIACDPMFFEAALELGRTHAMTSSWDEALVAYIEARRLRPDEPGVARGMAEVYTHLRQWSRAVDAWREVLHLNPDSVDAMQCIADGLRHAGCHQEAVERYDAVIARHADSAAALTGRGESLRALGRPAEALLDLDRALQIAPDDPQVMCGKAEALVALGRPQEALPYWEDALAARPAHGPAVRGRDLARQRIEAGTSVVDLPSLVLTETELAAHRAFAWGNALAADARWAESAGALHEALEGLPTWVEAAHGLADALFRDGRLADARSAYEHVLDLDGERLAAACGLAAIEAALGDYDLAIEAYERALVIDPSHPDALLGVAEALRLSGRTRESLGWYERVVRRQPTHGAALRGRATALVLLHRFGEALPLWRRALAVLPDAEEVRRGLRHCEAELERRTRGRMNLSPLPPAGDPPARAAARVLQGEGLGLLRQSRYREAVESLTACTKKDPGWARSWYLLGLALDGDGQHARAARVMDEVLAIEPDNAAAMCQKGHSLRGRADWAEAVQAYDAALALRRGDLDAIVGRATSLQRLARFDEALAGFDAALQMHADHLDSLVGKASCLVALRRPADALGVWEAAVRVAPSRADARAGLLRCRRVVTQRDEEPAVRPPPIRDRQGARDAFDRGRSFHKDREFGRAIECFREALALDSTMADAGFRLGLAYEDDRQFRRAVEAYQRCLSLQPKHVQAATNIGEALRKNERYAEAVEAYDRALAVRGDYLYALAGRAESMRMLGQYEECLQWFDAALRVGPRHAFALQGKAAALNSLERYVEALPLWERALEIDPRSRFALDGKADCEGQLTHTAEGTEEGEEEEEESPTPTLDVQGRDLTALAREGSLGQVVGREMEIRAVMKTLVRRQKANPLLLGDPGVGKTAVVEGMAGRLVQADVPKRLADIRLIELSVGSLIAGTKYRGTFEERLRSIVREASDDPNIVLFIDEIHTLVGAGRTEGGSLDAANILKPALARGDVRVIGATTMSEYRKHFENDAALERRFQPIQIEEPSAEEATHLIEEIAWQYAEHHEVQIQADAIAASVRLAVRFLPDRRLPDKALDLLDESCADASLSGEDTVTGETVARVLAERTHIAVGTLTLEERERINTLETGLSARVLGQSHAIRALASAVRISRAGLRDPQRPRGVFMFVGPSGVGKTELATVLAELLFPDSPALIRLDMSEYGERFTASRLVGAPPGYSGHGEEGQLTGKLRRRPYSVVLLDEFGKAHADVQTMFLSLFEDGTIESSDGRRVEAREAVFILTTNVGCTGSSRGKVGFSSDGGGRRRAILRQVDEAFRPELVNRLDAVVVFDELDEAVLHDVVHLHLTRLAGRAQEQGATLLWDEEVVDLCVRTGHNPKHGARPALRAIQSLVAEPLGTLLVDGGPDVRRVVRAVVEDDRVRFDEVPAPQAMPAQAPEDEETDSSEATSATDKLHQPE